MALYDDLLSAVTRRFQDLTRLPTQAAVEIAATEIAAALEAGIPWHGIADAVAAAGVVSRRGALVSGRHLAACWAALQRKRRAGRPLARAPGQTARPPQIPSKTQGRPGPQPKSTTENENTGTGDVELVDVNGNKLVRMDLTEWIEKGGQRAVSMEEARERAKAPRVQSGQEVAKPPLRRKIDIPAPAPEPRSGDRTMTVEELIEKRRKEKGEGS